MTYRSKLLMACLVLLAMTLTAAAFSFWSAGQFHHHSERSRFAHLVLEGHLQLKARTYKLFKQFADAMMGGSFDDSFGEAPLRQTLQQDMAALRDLIANEMALVEGQEWLDEKRELQALALLEQQILDVVREFEAAHALLEAGRRDKAWVMLRGTLERSIDEDFSRLVRQLIEEEEQEVAAIDEAAAAMITKVRWLAAALAVAAIIATGTFLSGLMARLQQPLRALVDGMARLSVGDFGQRIAVSGRDEFAQLANGLNAMADQLQRHSLQANAARDDLERVVSQRTKELQDANRALQGSDNARRRLFADISHELRTPTTAIRGEAEITLRGTDRPADEYRAALRRIVDTARQLGGVIDDLLAMARSDIDALALVKRPLDLAEPVNEALLQAQALASGRGVRLQAGPMPDHGCTVLGDAQRLRQLLLVLLDNAVRYSHAGGTVAVRLQPEAAAPGRPPGWRVEVQDAGIGIAAHELPQVFERHFRGQQARRHRPDGSGLGLPIAQSLARAHGGQLTLSSVPEQGTLAQLWLPALQTATVLPLHADVPAAARPEGWA